MGFDLRSAMAVLRKWWWLVLLAPIIGGGAGYAIGDRQTPMYSATATLMVLSEPGEDPAEYQDVQIAQALTQTYAELLLNRQVLQPVVDQQGDIISLEELQASTIVGVSGGTLLNVAVANEDPVLAANLANAIAGQFVDFAATMPETGGAVTLTEGAVPPGLPYAPRVPVYVLLGGVVGLLLASGFVFMVDQLDTRHRSGKQLEGLRPLAVVPKVSRMPRKRLQLFQQQDPGCLAANSIRTLRAAVLETYIPEEVKTHRGQVIGCFAPTSQSGQSVVVANLALSLANSGTSVALVDLNFRNPTLAQYFGVSSKRGVVNLLHSDGSTWESHSVPVTNQLRLLLPGKTSRNAADILADPMMARTMLRIADAVDVVLLDIPAADISSDSGLLARFLDSAIIVARDGRTRRQAVYSLASELDRAGTLVLGVVTTFGRSRRVEASGPQLETTGQVQAARSIQPVASSTNEAYGTDGRQFA